MDDLLNDEDVKDMEEACIELMDLMVADSKMHFTNV